MPGDFFTAPCAAAGWPLLPSNAGSTRTRLVLVLTRRVRSITPPRDVCMVLLDDNTVQKVDAKVLDEALMKWRADPALRG